MHTSVHELLQSGPAALHECGIAGASCWRCQGRRTRNTIVWRDTDDAGPAGF
ncbi:hypothetical protein KF840_09205 [bacterium]|nr:hypothetical protein [bacterium]